jgi:formate dehydrogenase major subunit
VILYSKGDLTKGEKAEITHIEGDTDHPTNRGTLCPKGAALLDTVRSASRLQHPMLRRAGGDTFEQISWDEALDKIARKVKQVRDDNWIATEKDKDKDGNEVEYVVNRTEAIGFLGGAQNTNEECYLYAKMGRLLGTPLIEHQARL